MSNTLGKKSGPNPAARQYPTRSVRVGGKVVRLYLGIGPVATALAAAEEADRLHALAAEMAVRELDAAYAPVRAARQAAAKELWGDYRAVLAAAGYRCLKKIWRKTRMPASRPSKPAAGVWTTDLGRAARDAWLDLVGGGDGSTRAAAAEELRNLQAAWADPHDPPVLTRLVEAAATAWLEHQYFHARYGKAEAAGVPAVHTAALADRAVVALGRYERLLKSLVEARHLLARADAAHAQAAKLRGRRRRKKPAARPRPPTSLPAEAEAKTTNRVQRFFSDADQGDRPTNDDVS